MSPSWKKPRTFDRNLVVIGAGSAGLVSALVAAKAGAKVTLIEANKMGGDCLNTGCVPSKAIIHAARLVAQARAATRMGLLGPAGHVDSAAAMRYVRSSIAAVAPHDSVERYRGLGVDVRRGNATISSPWTVEVDGDILSTRAIIIAAGAEPAVPPIPGIRDTGFLTSETIWNLETVPKRLLVLGGGPIGCELSQAFARLGAEVTVAQRADRLLEREDDEVSDLIRVRLAQDGVRVLTGHQAIAAECHGNERKMLFDHQGKRVEVAFDGLLIAVGRKPRTTGYGLEALGIKLSPKETIETNHYLQTLYPNIFACGDVAGPSQFTHAAGYQAWHASFNALFGGLYRIRPDRAAVPAVTYVEPEVARVGLNERQAKAQGVPYEVTRYDLSELDRAIVDDAREGFVKVLTHPGKDRILGATIVAPRAGEMLAELALAMHHGLGLKKVFSIIHPYPTYTEANRDVAGAWRNKHAPPWLFRWLARYHRWMRGAT
jgi:pyruvate/2-oxoglutarate dehydrogenase complex dihydrolipoamide dehydrogenase (E3) component